MKICVPSDNVWTLSGSFSDQANTKRKTKFACSTDWLEGGVSPFSSQSENERLLSPLSSIVFSFFYTPTAPKQSNILNFNICMNCILMEF